MATRYEFTGKKTRHFLKEWREARGLTLVDMSKAIGMSEGNLSRVERGLYPYSEHLIQAYAETLRCSPGALISYDPSEEAMFTIIDQLRAELNATAVEKARVALARKPRQSRKKRQKTDAL